MDPLPRIWSSRLTKDRCSLAFTWSGPPLRNLVSESAHCCLVLHYDTLMLPASTFSLTALTLLAAALVLQDPSPVANTIAAVLSHISSINGVGIHSDSLSVLM